MDHEGLVGVGPMPVTDPFDDLARYYDGLMESVDYDRWLLVAMSLAELAPADPFTHLDVACGTGLLAKRLRQHTWPTVGVDLSVSMLRSGKAGPHAPPTAAADMRSLPFAGAFGYVTCLFDSVNFLLADGDLAKAFRSVRASLRDDGIFYFDTITERMVVDHFEGREWTEKNGRFRSSWESVYDRKTGVASTTIRVNRQPHALIRERVYARETVERGLEAAGLELLGVVDAETWEPPTKKSIRLEYVSSPSRDRALVSKYEGVAEDIRGLLRA